jgi:hypothetical protein
LSPAVFCTINVPSDSEAVASPMSGAGLSETFTRRAVLTEQPDRMNPQNRMEKNIKYFFLIVI